MPTIKDIARECGVSANTVSSVLNNKPGEVSAATRDRILESMRRLGYRPNAAARRMVGKRSNTIGIADRYTEHALSDPYKMQILEPLVHAARSGRWDVLYYSGHPNEGQAGGFLPFLDGRCDGLLCFTGSIEEDEQDTILKTGLPVVFIGETQGEHSGQKAAVIDVDNEMGGYLAAAHLADLGHTRIGMMQGLGIAGNLHRIAGYQKALAERGLPIDDKTLYPTTAWEGSAYAVGLEVLSRPAEERPTAIFCFNDGLALGLLKAALECGLQVPEDLSIVGFDDVVDAAISVPPLTTVRQPLAWIGKRAVEILIDIIEGKLPQDYLEIVSPELVNRATTSPPRKKTSTIP